MDGDDEFITIAVVGTEVAGPELLVPQAVNTAIPTVRDRQDKKRRFMEVPFRFVRRLGRGAVPLRKAR